MRPRREGRRIALWRRSGAPKKRPSEQSDVFLSGTILSPPEVAASVRSSGGYSALSAPYAVGVSSGDGLAIPAIEQLNSLVSMAFSTNDDGQRRSLTSVGAQPVCGDAVAGAMGCLPQDASCGGQEARALQGNDLSVEVAIGSSYLSSSKFQWYVPSCG